MTHSIVYYDGDCSLCNRSVTFIIKRDRKDTFRFSSLQSAYAVQHLSNLSLSSEKEGKTLILVLKESNKIKIKSSAVLAILRELSGRWPLLYVFILIPQRIRDGIYDWVARKRYTWFGRQNQCCAPLPECKVKFLNE